MSKKQKKRNYFAETIIFDIASSEKKPKKQRNSNPDPVKRFPTGSEPGAKEPVGLRIIGGTFRGRKLQYIGDNRVRPMKDRVREAVFNLIGPVIKGMYAVDLFGGTGAIAIEAVSRGASAATVIEIHLPTAALLKQNLESLNLSSVCRLLKTDAFFWSKSKEDYPPPETPWIVFCSPPYDFYVSRKEEMLDMLHRLVDAAPAGSIFVIEADSRFDMTLLPIVPEPNRIRSYPPAVAGIFVK